jgi:1-acyl-sn-glycerol-3-phosphate acyltransferase
MASHLRASARALHMLGHVLQGMATVVWRFPRLNSLERQQRAGLGQRLAGQGRHPAGSDRPSGVGRAGPAGGQPHLVAGHPGHARGALCRFVSKDDVQLAVIGRLATAAGTLYIARSSRRDAQRMVQTMADSLAQAMCWPCFPKAPRAMACLLFHSNLLQSAVWPMCRCSPWRCAL